MVAQETAELPPMDTTHLTLNMEKFPLKGTWKPDEQSLQHKGRPKWVQEAKLQMC